MFQFHLKFNVILFLAHILEFLLRKKSAKRLQIPRVKNGLLNVGTCNAYIVLFIPSFFVPRQKCMDSNLRMYLSSLLALKILESMVWRHILVGWRSLGTQTIVIGSSSLVQDKQKMNKGQDWRDIGGHCWKAMRCKLRKHNDDLLLLLDNWTTR